MPTYIYETTDAAKPIRRFEIKQSMADAPLSNDPETGRPVRRVISGGYGFIQKGAAGAASPAQSCGSGCGCH